MIRKIINCVCWNCSKLLCPKKGQRFEMAMMETGDKRLSAIYELCKGIKACSLKEKKKDKEKEGENVEETNENQGCDFLQPKCIKKKIFNLLSSQPLKFYWITNIIFLFSNH